MLHVTGITAAVCALIYLGLSYHVVQRRAGAGISLGDGGDAEMLARVRTHANFGEYVPLILILMALIELQQGAPAPLALYAAGATLIVARLAHILGMHRPSPNPFRIAGTALTWTLLGLLGLWLLASSL